MVPAYARYGGGYIKGHLILRSHDKSCIVLLSLTVTLQTLKVFHRYVYATVVCGSCPLLNPGNNQHLPMLLL